MNGSLHPALLTERTPVPMPELVLINYQQRPYPAATGKKEQGKKGNISTFTTTTDGSVNSTAAAICRACLEANKQVASLKN